MGRSLFEKALAAGRRKASMPPGRAFALAVLAGVFISFGATFMLLVKGDKAITGAASSLLSGLVFSLGLFLVLVAGAELFTGNCLMVLGCADRRYAARELVRSWAVVWAGNLVGSLALVALMAAANVCGLLDGGVGDAMVSVAATKAGLAPGVAFARGILCNVLVCLAVWCGFGAQTVTDRLCCAILPVMAFVALGFEHSVANMFFLPMGMAAAAAGYGAGAVVSLAGVACNIVVVTAGNIVGGAAVVAGLYWLAYAQRRPVATQIGEGMEEIDERKRELRRHFKAVREELGEELRARIDAGIARRVASLDAWQAAGVVLSYLSVGDEVDTRELIGLAWEAGKTVAVPRVTGKRQMAWHVISDFGDLEVSKLRVEEPAGDPATLLDLGACAAAGHSIVALVPGLTFDADGFRLGYGGGFYDAFLAELACLGGTSVGLCRACQRIRSLYNLGVVDAHDRPVDLVVTEA